MCIHTAKILSSTSLEKQKLCHVSWDHEYKWKSCQKHQRSVLLFKSLIEILHLITGLMHKHAASSRIVISHLLFRVSLKKETR